MVETQEEYAYLKEVCRIFWKMTVTVWGTAYKFTPKVILLKQFKVWRLIFQDDFSRIFTYGQLSHDLPLLCSASPLFSNMPLLFCSLPWFSLLPPSPSLFLSLLLPLSLSLSPLSPPRQASFPPRGSQWGSDYLWGQFTCVILKGEYGQGSGPAGQLLAALEILRNISFVIYVLMGPR